MDDDDGLHLPEATGGLGMSNGRVDGGAHGMSFFETSRFIAEAVADLVPKEMVGRGDGEEGIELLPADGDDQDVEDERVNAPRSTLAIRMDPTDAEASTLAIQLTIISRAEILDAGLMGYRITGEHHSACDPFFRWSLAPGIVSSKASHPHHFKVSQSNHSLLLSPFAIQPPPDGVKVQGNPRKDFDAAMSNLHWGFYSSAFATIVHLASIGFVPAKSFVDPATSPLKNPTQASYLGTLLMDRGEEGLGLQWLKKGAEGGSGSATLEYAKRLAATDPGEAMAWLHRAWELTGDADAAFFIGCIFSNGGLPRRAHGNTGKKDGKAWNDEGDLLGIKGSDKETGTSHDKQDADDDGEEEEEEVDEGKNYVPWGIIDPSLASQKPVLRDPAQATLWWARGVEKGHHRSMAAYGETKLAGLDNSHPDLDKAFRFLTTAADRVPRAMFVLGHCYRHGLGCKRSDDDAAKWLRKAAAGGFSDESMHASSSYEDMEDISARAVKGVRLLRKAAETGVPRAMYVLGLCLQRGFGVPRDPDEARMWLSKADEAGYVPSVVDPVGGAAKTAARVEAELDAPARKSATRAKSDLLAAAAAAALAATGGSALGGSLLGPLKDREKPNFDDVTVPEGHAANESGLIDVSPVSQTNCNSPITEGAPSATSNHNAFKDKADLLALGDSTSPLHTQKASPSTVHPPKDLLGIETHPAAFSSAPYPYPLFMPTVDSVEVFARKTEEDHEDLLA
ncbi:hypothetical protein HDU67_001668 [Dinochytrium kinnereticum]|nr:hypothetical protein HDU67_001668 [Dinochytrium kinnereticum]